MDDEPGIRLLLVTFLQRRGFHLLEARNGREALALMRAGGVDAVIMDLMMPEVSGWDVLRERATDRSLQQTPMIVVTAVNIPKVTAEVVGKHVHAVLGKPFDLDALLEAVTTCLVGPDLPALAAA